MKNALIVIAAMSAALLLLFANAILKSRQKQSEFDRSARCSAQADKLMATAEERPAANGWATHRSHYDPDTNRCFIEAAVFGVAGPKMIENRSVEDAFAGAELASITIFDDSEVTECYAVDPHAQVRRTCRTKEEFLKAIRPYMADAGY